MNSTEKDLGIWVTLLKKTPLPITPNEEYTQFYSKIPDVLGICKNLQGLGYITLNSDLSQFEITPKGEDYIREWENRRLIKKVSFMEIPSEIRRLTEQMNNGHTDVSLKMLYDSASTYYQELFTPGNPGYKKAEQISMIGDLWASIDVQNLTITQTEDGEIYEFVVFGKIIRLDSKAKDMENCEKFRFYILKEFNVRLPMLPKQFWELMITYWRLKNIDKIRRVEDTDNEYIGNVVLNYLASCNVVIIEDDEKPDNFHKAFNDRYIVWNKNRGYVGICNDNLKKLMKRENILLTLKALGSIIKKYRDSYKGGESRHMCEGQRKVFWHLNVEKMGWNESELLKKVLDDENSD